MAGVELLAGLLLGQAGATGRADLHPFLAFRPLGCAAAVLFMQGAHLPARWGAYGFGLTAAAAGEALWLWSVGGSLLSADAARAVLAAIPLLLVMDVVATAAARLSWPPAASGRLVALLVIGAMLLWPGSWVQQAYGRLVHPPAEGGQAATAPPHTALTILTGLPLRWGEGSALEAQAPDAPKVLGRYFRIGFVDTLDDALRKAAGGVLLLAQPQRLAPHELVRLDSFVQQGGRVLVLVDPDLRWPTDHPLGHPLAPSRATGLEPWLARLGLALDRRDGTLIVEQAVNRESRLYRLRLASPGRFEAATGGPCDIEAGGLLAECNWGRGRVALVADADLLHDLLWRGPGPDGADADLRTADNIAWIADLVAALRGQSPPSPMTAWAEPRVAMPLSALLALIPPILLLVSATFPRRNTR